MYITPGGSPLRWQRRPAHNLALGTGQPTEQHRHSVRTISPSMNIGMFNPVLHWLANCSRPTCSTLPHEQIDEAQT